jgi:hypothetical protein
MTNAAIVTTEILEAYLLCPYKASLLLAGHTGTKTDYEIAVGELRDGVRQKAIEKLYHGQHRRPVQQGGTLSDGSAIVLDRRLEIDGFSVQVDGLRRADGPSSLGDFHYEPLLFHEGRKVRELPRLLIRAHAVLLARVQGRLPNRGVVYHWCQITCRIP